MLTLLSFMLVSIAWLILGGLIINDSGVYRPYTRKAKLLSILIYGPAWWLGIALGAAASIPIWLFKQLSRWLGNQLKKANNER